MNYFFYYTAVERKVIKVSTAWDPMNWYNGKPRVNGIKIKDADVQKYESLTEKYFGGNKGYYKRN